MAASTPVRQPAYQRGGQHTSEAANTSEATNTPVRQPAYQRGSRHTSVTASINYTTISAWSVRELCIRDRNLLGRKSAASITERHFRLHIHVVRYGAAREIYICDRNPQEYKPAAGGPEMTLTTRLTRGTRSWRRERHVRTLRPTPQVQA
jgi:hypothetical protein